MAELNINTDELPENEEYQELPDGDYPCIVIESEIKETQAGDGSFLKLTLQVFDGDYKGRLIWENLNLYNKNDTTVKIAEQTLKSICKAVSFSGQLKDSVELHDTPLVVTLYRNKKGNQGKKFKSLLATSASKKVETPESKKPWQKK